MHRDLDTRILVVLEKTENGYSAYLPDLSGCVATGATIHTVRNQIRDAIEFHIEGMRSENLPVPVQFAGDGERDLAFKMDIASLFEWFSGILTKSGVSRVTGMNQSLISQYASGIKTPSNRQSKKIERALHHLGQELLEIEL
ncbi:MAG: type II toxin-antitoxin system HicB family antitoxin [Bacteroidales bacterium]|nr:type II toxin-antitoxin system HicB family antitoxin [Bacteroidales bacterium]